jgi:tRNA nucleotidyltransferase (CCA-adding enzyme)
MSPTEHEIDLERLEERIAGLPGLVPVREASREHGLDSFLVGGAVRDLLLGAARAELDVVVVGDQLALVEALGGETRVHDRFGTATVLTPAGPIDVARARAESYPHPGALPNVRPAGIEDDLARRDFTVNAIAVPLAAPFELLDPHGGVADLAAGLLRSLHPRSFVDDPTRALRAARYAARLELEPEPETLGLLREADLETVSEDRVEAELRRIAAEPRARHGFDLLGGWGLIEVPAGADQLIDRAVELLADEPWSGLASRSDTVLAALNGPSERAMALAAASPRLPSEGVALARGASPVTLAHARVLGAEWLDPYVSEWRLVRTEISGSDLLAEGVPEGPAVGAGLAAALRAKLDGETAGRADELRVALEAAAAARRP